MQQSIALRLNLSNPAVIVRGVIKENPTIIQKHAGNGNDQYKLSRKNFANDSLIQSTNRVFDEQNNE